ncbi:hypothetical protein ACFVR2_02310 [Gottfriedia sp. NPDC057991]|uniref:hypothetical protein n=1 Tax=Gottfriedia sp. NPDC057991 TaxID=3346298 RepID=UPI0036DB6C82
MKKFNFVCLFLCTLIFLSACNKDNNKIVKSKVLVFQKADSINNLGEPQFVTDKNRIQNVSNILKSLKWEKRTPDTTKLVNYFFWFEIENNDGTKEKILDYDIRINSTGQSELSYEKGTTLLDKKTTNELINSFQNK